MQMADELMKAEGINGTVLLFRRHLTIKRKGMGTVFTHGLKGDKDIQLSSISSVQFKKAGFTSGYIQFAFMGGQESQGGVLSASRDENTVLFRKGHQEAFELLRDAVQERISNDTGDRVVSPADEIGKLAGLKEKGIITEKEFAAKKKQLLGL